LRDTRWQAVLFGTGPEVGSLPPRPIEHVSKPVSSVFYTLIYFIRLAVPKEYIPVLPPIQGTIYKEKPHLVLAFPMPLDKRMRFADRHKLDVDLLPSQIDISAQIYIHEHIAEHRRNVTSVQYEPEKWDLAWAVATRQKRTSNMLCALTRSSTIKSSLTEPPKWYYAREVPEFWYVSDTPACHSFLNATLSFCQCGHILSEGSFFDSYIIPPLVCKHATQYERSSGQTGSCNYYLVY